MCRVLVSVLPRLPTEREGWGTRQKVCRQATGTAKGEGFGSEAFVPGAVLFYCVPGRPAFPGTWLWLAINVLQN
jgi:hypothetical protein